jgi:hypothetical protein
VKDVLLKTLRNRPDTKVDLIVEPNGWRETDDYIERMKGKAFEDCYVLRAIQCANGNASVKEVRLRESEARELARVINEALTARPRE